MSEEELRIPEGGSNKFLKGEFAKQRGITKFRIVAPAPHMVSFTDNMGKATEKVQITVEYLGQSQTDPDTITLNNTTSRGLKVLFGSAKPSEWMGKVFPIEVSKTAKGYAILLDELVAKADTETVTTETKQEEL